MPVPELESNLTATYKCPECGCDRFVMVQTGYERHTPCMITPSGKKAIMLYKAEVLDEGDDGGNYHRYVDCAKCGHTLCYDDDVDVHDMDLIEPSEVAKNVTAEDYVPLVVVEDE